MGDYAVIRLHHGYPLPGAPRKTGQQYVGPFKVKRKIGNLAYELDIPTTWSIHPVFSVAMLEPAPTPTADPYNRPTPKIPETTVYDDGEPHEHLIIDRLINRRITKRRGKEIRQYLVRWKDRGPE